MAAAARPPRMARFLLRLCRLGARRPEIEQDLADLHARRARRSRAYAAARYWMVVISLWRIPPPSSRPELPSARVLLADTASDVRFAARIFLGQPVLTTIAVFGLALAIGIATAVFSLVHAAALRAPLVRGSDAVVRVLVKLAGLTPVRYGRRGDLLAASAGIGPTRLRHILLGAQAAGSLMLLVVAALLGRSLINAATLDVRFDPNRLITLSVPFEGEYTATHASSYWDAALDRVSHISGVRDVALVAPPPVRRELRPGTASS